MEDILRTLDRLMPELPPHLRRAARRILDRPNEVAVLSMRALAAEAKVSPPTMLRLARRAGFDSYESFRAVFQDRVTGGRFRQKAQALQDLGARKGRSGLFARMMHAASENIARCSETLDADAIARAAELLRESPNCYAVGVGALYWMSAYLQYLSRAALPQLRVPHVNGNAVVESLVGLQKNDAVLIMSVAPYAKQIVKAAEFSRSSGAKVIALTDSRGSPLTAYADLALVAPTDSPQFYPSMIAVVGVIEALIAQIISLGHKPTLARMATIDRLRRAEGGYLELLDAAASSRAGTGVRTRK
jgi:DNA-binding MurR/RpiR family transcriptional regulator